MSLYRRLAQLRPGMPFSALSDIIGSGWKPGTNGGVTVNGCVFVRFDLNGTIGAVRFNPGFPERILIEGLRLNMPLDKVLSARRFEAKGPNEFKTLDVYSYSAYADNHLLAHVSRAAQSLHSFEIVRPGLSYPTGNPITGRTEVVVAETNYADSAEMLCDWVESNAKEAPGDDCDLFARWLSVTATPDDWHQAAANWNWDYGLVPLFWIIRQPDCEKATALQLFYTCGPGNFIAEVPDGARVSKLQRELFDLFSEVRKRLMANFYTRATVAFDAAGAFVQEFGETPKDVRVFSVVPEPLRQNVAGRVLPNTPMAFADGFPDAMWR